MCLIGIRLHILDQRGDCSTCRHAWRRRPGDRAASVDRVAPRHGARRAADPSAVGTDAGQRTDAPREDRHANSGQSRLRRPEPLRPVPGHPARRSTSASSRSGRPQARPGLHRPPDRGAARAARARLLLRRAGRVHPPAERGRGHLAGPRARARRDRAAERRRRRRSPSARPAAPASRGQYHVIYEYEQEDVGLEAGRAGPAPAPLAAAARAPARGLRRRRLRLRAPSATSSSASPSAGRSGPSTASLVRAAEERDIPWIRLNDQSLIQFGHGRYQQRIQATITSQTPHIAVELASDKEETNQHPRRPRPAGAAPAAWCTTPRTTRSRRPSGIGYPVVVKPLNANHGRGVSIRPHDRGAGARRRSTWRASTAAASSSRASSPATTTGCW